MYNHFRHEHIFLDSGKKPIPNLDIFDSSSIAKDKNMIRLFLVVESKIDRLYEYPNQVYHNCPNWNKKSLEPTQSQYYKIDCTNHRFLYYVEAILIEDKITYAP